MSLKHKRSVCFSQAVRLDQTACDVCLSQAVRLDQTACDVGLSQAVCLDKTICDVCLSQAVFDQPPEMLFYITSGASQAVPESACVEANRTVCVELYCSSANSVSFLRVMCLITCNTFICVQDHKAPRREKKGPHDHSTKVTKISLFFQPGS
jgi:hypothetical protein